MNPVLEGGTNLLWVAFSRTVLSQFVVLAHVHAIKAHGVEALDFVTLKKCFIKYLANALNIFFKIVYL